MGFFQTYWTWQNAQLSSYIGDNTARVAGVLEPALVAMAVVYVMWWGYLHLTGRIEEPVATGLTRIVRLVVVLGIGLHLWLYNDVIVDTFYRAPTQLAQAVVGNSDPVDTVDAIWNRGGTVAENIRHLGSGVFSGAAFLFESLVVWAMTASAVCLRHVPDLALEHRFVGAAGGWPAVRRLVSVRRDAAICSKHGWRSWSTMR
jgi:type IV secretion system protein VirB6